MPLRLVLTPWDYKPLAQLLELGTITGLLIIADFIPEVCAGPPVLSFFAALIVIGQKAPYPTVSNH